MKASYVHYVLGLIAVLLFTANCDCQKDPVDPQHYWVVCNDLAAGLTHVTGTGGTPALTNGKDVQLSGQLFDPTQYSCPDTGGSPIWIGSGKPVYRTSPIKTSGLSLQPRALGPGGGAYLPPPLLDLPFPAQRQSSENTSLMCDPSQPDVLQVNHDKASVNRLATCPFAPVATIRVATRPLQIAITPDGITALVTSFDNAVNFIDLRTNTVVFTLATPTINPNGIAITPDGAFAYITSFTVVDPVIAKVDLTSRSVVATLPARAYPQNAILSPDGAMLLITYPFGNIVDLIDTQTFSNSIAFAIDGPRGIAFNSKGTKAYIASAGNASASGKIIELNTNTFQIANTYTVGVGPNDVAVLYGDQFVVTTNYEGNSVSKIDTVTGTVQTTTLTGQPSGLSIVR